MFHGRLSTSLLFITLTGAAVLSSKKAHASPIAEIGLTTSRIDLAALLNLEEFKGIDLGPAPPPGGSRLIKKEEIAEALTKEGKKAPKSLPEAVRVTRKMTVLKRTEMESLAQGALKDELPRGARVLRVRGEELRLPVGYDKVRIEVPKAPRRQGSWTTTTTLIVSEEGRDIARVPLTVDFLLDKDAMSTDLARGTTVQLFVHRGLVQLQSEAIINADADVGDVVPVTVRANGKTLRAKILDHDRAALVEYP